MESLGYLSKVSVYYAGSRRIAPIPNEHKIRDRAIIGEHKEHIRTN